MALQGYTIDALRLKREVGGPNSYKIDPSELTLSNLKLYAPFPLSPVPQGRGESFDEDP